MHLGRWNRLHTSSRHRATSRPHWLLKYLSPQLLDAPLCSPVSCPCWLLSVWCRTGSAQSIYQRCFSGNRCFVLLITGAGGNLLHGNPFFECWDYYAPPKLEMGCKIIIQNKFVKGYSSVISHKLHVMAQMATVDGTRRRCQSRLLIGFLLSYFHSSISQRGGWETVYVWPHHRLPLLGCSSGAP